MTNSTAVLSRERRSHNIGPKVANTKARKRRTEALTSQAQNPQIMPASSVFQSASLRYVDGQRRQVDAQDIEAFLLKVERVPSCSGADIKHAAADIFHRLSLMPAPIGIRRKIAAGAGGCAVHPSSRSMISCAGRPQLPIGIAHLFIFFSPLSRSSGLPADHSMIDF